MTKKEYQKVIEGIVSPIWKEEFGDLNEAFSRSISDDTETPCIDWGKDVYINFHPDFRGFNIDIFQNFKIPTDCTFDNGIKIINLALTTMAIKIDWIRVWKEEFWDTGFSINMQPFQIEDSKSFTANVEILAIQNPSAKKLSSALKILFAILGSSNWPKS